MTERDAISLFFDHAFGNAEDYNACTGVLENPSQRPRRTVPTGQYVGVCTKCGKVRTTFASFCEAESKVAICRCGYQFTVYRTMQNCLETK